MLEWADDLKLRGTDLFLDSRQPRARCFVSHAHSDHIADHAWALATPETAALAGYRVGLGNVTHARYGTELCLHDDTRVRLLPAGHVLGSAMLHATRPEGSLLYTGDFKLRECLTVERADPCPADVLVMETTFGLPFFRFPPRQRVIEELIERLGQALRDNRQPIVMGYSLGKAQEITRILTDAGFVVTLHGAAYAMHQLYEKLGAAAGPARRYRFEDFHGAQALDLTERGVLVAPPHVARSGFVTRFKNPCRIILTGWAMLKDAIYRYGVDHALPLSDHADFDELLELVERVHPRKIYTCHGYRAFVETLRAKGFDAQPAEPDAQLELFAG